MLRNAIDSKLGELMRSKLEDYDACAASSTQLRLCKLKTLIDSNCDVYIKNHNLLEEELKTFYEYLCRRIDSNCDVYINNHNIFEEEMKNVKRIECFDISKMNRLCPDVERHILGFIGNPCESIDGYAEYLWKKRGEDYTTGAYGGHLKWSLNMKKLYIIKNVMNSKDYTLFQDSQKRILRITTKTIDKMMSPQVFKSSSSGVFYNIEDMVSYCVKRDNDYKRLEWLNNKWKENPKKIERLATAEVKRLKETYK